MDTAFVQTLWVTFKLAVLTTLILVMTGIPFAYYLANSKSRIKPLVEALVSMPLVLPPSVLGYYLLLAYSPRNLFGSFLLNTFNVRLAFTFEGVLIASVLFSLPFMVQPISNALRAIPSNIHEASFVLGKSKTETFFYVSLPTIKNSMFSAFALTFAHCIGEFGVVLMVGGNMPGVTRVASIAIYDEFQSLNCNMANKYAFILFITSFLLLVLIYAFNRNKETWKVIS